MIVPLGTVVCASNAVDYRITANRLSPGANLPVQTVTIQQLAANSGTITIRSLDPETGDMANVMVLVAPASGAQPVSVSLSVPSGMNAISAENIYIRASGNGEGALCFCIQN